MLVLLVSQIWQHSGSPGAAEFSVRNGQIGLHPLHPRSCSPTTQAWSRGWLQDQFLLHLQGQRRVKSTWCGLGWDFVFHMGFANLSHTRLENGWSGVKPGVMRMDSWVWPNPPPASHCSKKLDNDFLMRISSAPFSSHLWTRAPLFLPADNPCHILGQAETLG